MNALTKTETGALALSERELLDVLSSSLYPGAAPESIKMVIGYCKAAGLDPMQKPVHIVPMWDAKASRMRDVVMPGVNLYRTQAARSGEFAGMSEPEFGPDKTQTIGGVAITFPEWCKVTVKRALKNGILAEFTATEYWLENYAIKGGKEKSVAPNAMWTKRPRGQIAKCASAQALRIAFPEIASQATAEEMEGKPLQPDADGVIDMPPQCPPALLGLAQSRADEGREAFGKFWKDIRPEDRSLLQPHLVDLQARVKKADTPPAEVVDPFVAEMDAAEAAGEADADR